MGQIVRSCDRIRRLIAQLFLTLSRLQPGFRGQAFYRNNLTGFVPENETAASPKRVNEG